MRGRRRNEINVKQSITNNCSSNYKLPTSCHYLPAFYQVKVQLNSSLAQPPNTPPSSPPPPFLPPLRLLVKDPRPRPSRTRLRPRVPSKPSTSPPSPSPLNYSIVSITFLVQHWLNKTYQSTHEVEHTSQQQADGRQDLEQRLIQQAPERVQLLLCVWHVLELALGVVDALRHVAGKVLEDLGEVVLLGRGLARRRLMLSVCRDAALGIQALDDAFGLVEDASAFLDQRLDFLYERLFVALVFGGALGLVNFLCFVLVRQ